MAVDAEAAMTDAFLLDLAGLLNNQSCRLSDPGRREQPLATIASATEATETGAWTIPEDVDLETITVALFTG